MLSEPRVTDSVVPAPAVTVTTSSLDVSGSTISVYGYDDGKPETDATMNAVFAAPCACAGMEPDNAVSTAIEE